ncbi:MAG TPA: class I SAM-dependent methyltransferase [Candidatus Omnitrophota bacterium]|nr:class I SAM-dependent methyltransferase [Candidatus Omnitrophota bacterium]HPS21060.1 class I SAM-dependent methyltransferase [Candidatus Omnitrophota bacterium]
MSENAKTVDNIVSKINEYSRFADEAENRINQRAENVEVIKKEFNARINDIFIGSIMPFEKECYGNDEAGRFEEFKKIFIEEFRPMFLKGEYAEWSLRKPYGYAGDFKILEDIYLNAPRTAGIRRLHDIYYQDLTVCHAVRNRKEDFKNFIVNEINGKNGHIDVMSLSSGPAREVKEMVDIEGIKSKDVRFDCYDHDKNAIEYARTSTNGMGNIAFYEANALKMALAKDITAKVPRKYDIIYSIGLFDYLNDRISVRLIENLKKLLKPDGKMMIASVRERYSNPSVIFMELVAEWMLVYRSDEDFRKVFLEAGFGEQSLAFCQERQGVMQYIIAKR